MAYGSGDDAGRPTSAQARNELGAAVRAFTGAVDAVTVIGAESVKAAAQDLFDGIIHEGPGAGESGEAINLWPLYEIMVSRMRDDVAAAVQVGPYRVASEAATVG